ncbi:hypothetical protein H7F33_08945 [Pedobacter sp. PAMC26386]|nr:hypothetical protein H7F33_08945 [Pedobacter sp. PAMC26386]
MVKKYGFIFLGIGAFIVLILTTDSYYNDQKEEDRIMKNCQNRKYYQVPLITFVNCDSSAIKDAVLEIIRGGRSIKTELGLKPIFNSDQSIDLELYGKDVDHPFIQKFDTLLITIKLEKHVLFGFTSNTIRVDHGVLLCHES